LNPDIPKDNATPPGQGLQETSSNGISPESSSGEQPTLNFGAPPEFQSKIIKKITPLKQEKVIALTFDDGPWPRNTLKILDILKKNNIKATFFWVGQALKDNPQIGKQVVAEGHTIGNHTWHHWYRRLDASTAAREIEDTAELIYKTTGVRTSLFRPPGGVMNNGVADYAKQKKDVIVMWSNDPMDYRPHSADQLTKYVIRKAQPGAIVLMHDGGGNHSATVEALPQMIAKLREQGYKFVTIPELMKMRDPQASEVIAKKDLPSSLTTNP
jgi:peptidoglycan/xylan/chitin deacetylase (PgdA/CDA1 family)